MPYSACNPFFSQTSGTAPLSKNNGFGETISAIGKFTEIVNLNAMFLDQVYVQTFSLFTRVNDLIGWIMAVKTWLWSGKFSDFFREEVGAFSSAEEREKLELKIRRRLRTILVLGFVFAFYLSGRKLFRKK